MAAVTLWRLRTAGNLTQRVLFFFLLIRHSLKLYFPVFLRVVDFVTSKVPWVSIFRTRMSNAKRNAQYTCGLPPSHHSPISSEHFDHIREETGTFPQRTSQPPDETRRYHRAIIRLWYHATAGSRGTRHRDTCARKTARGSRVTHRLGNLFAIFFGRSG